MNPRKRVGELGSEILEILMLLSQQLWSDRTFNSPSRAAFSRLYRRLRRKDGENEVPQEEFPRIFLEVRSQGVPRAENIKPDWTLSIAFQAFFDRGRGGRNDQWAFEVPERLWNYLVSPETAPRTWPRDPAIFRL